MARFGAVGGVGTDASVAALIDDEDSDTRAKLRAAFGLVYVVPPPTGVAATDQVAVQSVIDAATAEGGGIVDCQGGDYAMNAELILKDRVLVRGKGRRATRLIWSTDLGAGKYAVRQDAGAGYQSDAPGLDHIGIVGPNAIQALGVQSVNMDGWRIGRDVHATSVQVRGFRAGGVIYGDHNTMVDCSFNNNYYNLLYHGSAPTRGNQFYFGCNFTGAAFACVAIEQGTNLIDGSLFAGGHIGFAPYGFYRLGTASTGSMIYGTILDGLGFEAIGNAAIHDESTGSADSLRAVTINNPGFSWLSTYRIAELPRDYAVNVRNVVGCWIRSGIAPFTAGDVATYNIAIGSSFVGLTIEERGTIPTVAGESTNVRLDTGMSVALYRKATVAVTAGDLLESTGGQTAAPYGTTGRQFSGVALNTAAVNQYVAVAYSGRVSVGTSTAGISTGGVPVKPATGALTKVAPASSTGSSGYTFGGAVTPDKQPIIGYSNSDLPASGTGLIWLTGTQVDRTYVTPGAVTALPTASATYRGQMLRVEGGAGVADVLYVCMKDAANAYSWKTVTLA